MRSDSRWQAIEAALGPASIQEKDCIVYQGDAVELLRRLPKGSIDLTVTSPPYNIGKQYETNLPVSEYVDWCSDWIAGVHTATADFGAFWLNVGYLPLKGRAKALPIPYLLWDRVPFFLMQEVVWHYGAGVASRRSFSPRNEKFLWYVKNESEYVFNLDDVRDPNVKYPNQRKNGKLKCNPLGKNPSDVWAFPKVTSGRNRSSAERTAHPAQFPSAVIERVIKASSNVGDIVLDPFLGSGTTAEVALANGRRVVGFELRADYVDIASERLARAELTRRAEAAQGRLFDAE